MIVRVCMHLPNTHMEAAIASANEASRAFHNRVCDIVDMRRVSAHPLDIAAACGDAFVLKMRLLQLDQLVDELRNERNGTPGNSVCVDSTRSHYSSFDLTSGRCRLHGLNCTCFMRV